MVKNKIAWTAGAIVGVMVLAVVVAIHRVSSYEEKAAVAAMSTAGDLRLVEVKVPESADQDSSQERLLERCRKETQTTTGRELARSMGEEGIIALCLETAQVLSD